MYDIMAPRNNPQAVGPFCQIRDKEGELYENGKEGDGVDRRTRRTRTAIFAAFEELLMEKRYEQITVQDIIDRADIGRSTFYAHFETRDALLRAVCRELFEHIFSPHLPAESSHDFSAGEGTLDRMLTHILYHLRDDRRRYARIFACESAELFWSYFREQLTALLQQCDVTRAAVERGVPADFYCDFYGGAFIEAVKWWFRNDLSATPEKLAFYFEAVTSR